MIDFSQFDPWDSWWWRRTQWVLDELETQQASKVAELQHSHWITMASHSGLTDESFDNAKTNAGQAFNKFLKATYPWLNDELDAEGSKTANDALLAHYREEFGNPGDPQYEAMVSSLKAVFAKGPRTQWEKDRDRKAQKELRDELSSDNMAGE
jgi:hypothetical protein